MSAISITAANVAVVSGATITRGTAGATFTAGQTAYLDSATNTFKLCDADASSAAATCVGIALNGASSGQPLALCTAGDLTIGGSALTIGIVYGTGSTAGAINPASDQTTNWYPCVLGIAKTANILSMGTGPLMQSTPTAL